MATIISDNLQYAGVGIQQWAENPIVRFVDTLFTKIATAVDSGIEQKQSPFWECLNRTWDETGYIYRFKLRSQFHYKTEEDKEASLKAIVELQQRIFPAVEPTPDSSLIPLLTMIQKLQDIGYRYTRDETGIYLELPDKEVILNRIKQVRPDLSLKIIESQGIEEDLAFAEAYVNYDILLSDGVEFVHDQTAHAIPTLYFHLISPEFAVQRERIRGVVAKLIDKVKKVEPHTDTTDLSKIKTTIGTAVDIMWSPTSVQDLKSIDNSFFDDEVVAIWTDINYKNFWKKKFGEEIDIDAVRLLWNKIISNP